MFDIFRLLIFFIGGSKKRKFNRSYKNLIFWFLQFSHLSSFIIFLFFVPIFIMGKDIGRLLKHIWSKLPTTTLKKPVLSSSDAHASSVSNSTGSFISSRLDNKVITKNLNSNSNSNANDIHSCVTPQTQNYIVQDTSKTTCFTPLKYTLPIAPVYLHTQKKTWLVNNICVTRLTEDLLMLPSVSHHG